VAQEIDPLLALQHGLDLGSQRQRLFQVPLREYPGVYDQVVLLVDGQRTMAQPVDQFVAVGCCQDLVERVIPVSRADAAGHCQQVQVVVAQHGLGAVAHLHHGAQGLQGVGAAVDEVAGEEDTVGRKRRESCQQILQGGMAALQVSDNVISHGQCLMSLGPGEGSVMPCINTPCELIQCGCARVKYLVSILYAW